MSYVSYTFKRLLQMIPVLLIISVLVFFSLRLIGGNPARLMLGEKATEASIAALEEKLGLNEPLIKQYAIYMGQLLQGDLGKSIKFQTNVSELLANRLPTTLKLTGLTAVFSLLVSFPFGYIAARRKDKAADQVIRGTALTFIAMPSFWVGLLLMYFFGVKLRVLPAGGWADGGVEQLKYLILPAFTQSLMTIALLIRNIRNSVVDVQAMDYVDFAKSKGISPRQVRNSHVLRNALISTVTLFAMRIAYMLGGSVIIESVFSLPGIGKLLLDSIFARDYVVVQSMVLIFALLVLVVNLITDLIYSALDPRVVY